MQYKYVSNISEEDDHVGNFLSWEEYANRINELTAEGYVVLSEIKLSTDELVTKLGIEKDEKPKTEYEITEDEKKIFLNFKKSIQNYD